YRSPATLTLVPLEVQVAPRRVGYVPGPGDDLAGALRELGLEPVLLDAARLASPAAWASLQTIVVGARAYEVNDALLAANSGLLQWARAGGTLVVMYQKYPYATPGLAPLPFTYDEPHDRVVDETAPVTLLQPEHPLLSRPNCLGEADFAGWVQERGLYFWDRWDAGYTPLLTTADPGEPPQEGGLLVAPLGQGHYVYCGYALFRQLPAGVPGAWRLLANLLAYGG
ncbi:MAG: hypothetical protein HUU35_16735, partial [Armatimonadetes bacterium]|nr:hypothetical protein [Armatimonadota bacterium]